MVRVNQRSVDLTVRPHSFPDTTSISGRTQVSPTSLIGNAINIVFPGQSTNSSAISGGAFSLVNPTKVYNGSVAHKASIWRADDTSGLLDCDIVEGHHGMDLGDALVTAVNAPNVVLWPIAHGASTIAQWNGELKFYIGLVARSIYAAGLDVNKTFIDFQHGEANTDAATAQGAYAADLNAIITEFKNVGLLRTGNFMFVHLCTRIAGLTASRNAVRAAQASVVDGVLVRAGADIDTITTNRPDGTHFNRAGAAAQAALKLPLYQSLL